jgi:polyphosphate glucokinase
MASRSSGSGKKDTPVRRGRPPLASAGPDHPLKILVVDIGGTNIKVLVSGASEPRKAPSGKRLTPGDMITAVKKLARGWSYDAVSIGYPGVAGQAGPKSEPGNLGKGWVGFDFAAAFERPVKVANDAAMQALGSYDGGRMLFLGVGTGLGSALITDRTIIPLELGELPWNRDRETLGDALSAGGFERLGARAWRKVVAFAASRLMKALLLDYVVIGGGNAKKLDQLPHGLRIGHNQTAFRGGFRLWSVDDVPELSPGMHRERPPAEDWRLL